MIKLVGRQVDGDAAGREDKEGKRHWYCAWQVNSSKERVGESLAGLRLFLVKLNPECRINFYK